MQNSKAFADAGARVVMIYPGPPQELGAKAKEFLADKKLPDNFDLVLDPGYEFTIQYGLRWDAPHETAYPSTFLIDRQGTVFFSKIVKEHGGELRPRKSCRPCRNQRPGNSLRQIEQRNLQEEIAYAASHLANSARSDCARLSR